MPVHEQTATAVQAILANHPGVRPNLVLSHGDTDHYNLIPTVLGGIQVNEIWQGGDKDDYSEAEFPAWIAGQVEGDADVHIGFDAHFHNEGEALAELPCGGASTFILTVNTGSTKDSQSLILLVEHAEFTAIYTGDAEGTTERRALANFASAVKATLLTGSHHGADTNGSNGTFDTDDSDGND